MTEECLSIVQWLKNWFTSTDDLIDKTYPVGSIYMSVNNTSPSTLFGGTWVQLTDTFLYASNTADTNSTTSTDGEATHTLSSDEMPSHTHTQDPHNHSQNDHAHLLPNSAVVYNASLSRGLVSNASSTKVSLNSTLSSQMGVIGAKGTNNPTTATNQNTGGDSNGNTVAHNNMPPYMKVYMWKRTA